MKQISLAGSGTSGFERSSKVTRKQVFLQEMNRVVPWDELIALIEPHAPKSGKQAGRPAVAVSVLLRIHFLQQWFNLSDPAMEEALHDVPLFRQFAGLDMGDERLPDESTILRFRHLLQTHELSQKILATVNGILTSKGLLLKEGTVLDATLIAAPSSTKNADKARDPEMHQSKKGNQWHFGMKAHIGVDADSGLVHTVTGTAANEHDVTQASELLHGLETHVYADAGYQGVDKREDVQAAHPQVQWRTAMRPGARRQLDKTRRSAQLLDQLETVKAQIRAKVEHPFRVIKRQLGYVKVRYRGLAKNTQQLYTLFALSNLWMLRKHPAMQP